jgi:hypothetical protein
MRKASVIVSCSGCAWAMSGYITWDDTVIKQCVRDEYADMTRELIDRCAGHQRCEHVLDDVEIRVKYWGGTGYLPITTTGRVPSTQSHDNSHHRVSQSSPTKK